LHSYTNNGETISGTDAPRANLAGLGFTAGGLLFILYFIGLNPLLQAFDMPVESSTVSTLKMAVACVSGVCLACGLFGLLTLGVTGVGRKKMFGVVGTLVALLGLTLYIVGSIYIYAFPQRAQFFMAGGSALIMLGMLLLSAAVLSAKTLRGWRAAAPLLVALYFPLQFPFQAVFFLKQGRGPSPVLLGSWGVFWVLLGAAVWTWGRRIDRNSVIARLGAETCRDGQVASHQAG